MIRTFEHDLFAPVALTRIDGQPTGRVYEDSEGNRYNSVTNVIGKMTDKGALDKWIARVGTEEANRVKNLAAHRGTAFHNLAEKYLNNDANYKRGVMPVHLDSFSQIRPYLDQYIGKIYGIEHQMFSRTLKAAGTADLIAFWKDEIAIIDFKTSRKPKLPEHIKHYFLQATTYAMMVQELYGIEVERYAIVMAVDHSEPLIFEGDTDQYRSQVIDLFGRFNQANPIC